MNRAVGVASGFMLLLVGSFAARGQTNVARRLVTTPVEINSIRGTFLIDTGSEGTIIDSAFAERLGLKPSGSLSLQGNYSKDHAITVVADAVRIGPKLWSDVKLVVQDLSLLSQIQGAPLSGVLGTNLITGMILRLSYSSGTAEVITDIGGNASVVALRKVGNLYFVPIKIGPSTFDMVLDSGTNITALSDSAWRALPSSWKPNGLVEGILSSGSPTGALIACIPTLHLGDKAPNEVVLRDYPLRVIMASQSGFFANAAFSGILGGDVLERFEVTLDLRHSAIYLKPDIRFQPDPYEFVTVGIQFLKADASAFSVAAVWKHSPAEAAGVLVGDRVLSVNGHSSADLGLDTFARQLHAPAGTPVVIEVERAARKLILHMQTRQLVCEATGAR
jgi:hypothetical protein